MSEGIRVLSGWFGLVTSKVTVMNFAIGLMFGAIMFSLINSLLSSIRASRPKKTDYQIWLDEVAKDNIVTSRRDFSMLG